MAFLAGLVTGGTGLLGSHLIRALLDEDAEVVALVRDSVPRSLFHSSAQGWDLSRRVTTVRGEIEDYTLLERVLNEYEIDTVFHWQPAIVGTANRSPLGTFRANVEGTWNVLEAARVHSKRVRRVIVASSDKAYGNLKGAAYDESFPLQGEHPYDVSKSCSDLISRSYFVSYGLPVAITRCGNFFGPGDLNFSRIIPGTIRDVLDGRRPVIRSDGSFIRDYIYAEDGAHAYLTLAGAMSDSGGRVAHAGEAFNFSYGLRLSVSDVVEKVLVAMDRKDLKPEIRNEASNEIPVQCLDSAKARKQLGWAPRFGFEEGLKQTIAWYRSLFGHEDFSDGLDRARSGISVLVVWLTPLAFVPVPWPDTQPFTSRPRRFSPGESEPASRWQRDHARSLDARCVEFGGASGPWMRRCAMFTSHDCGMRLPRPLQRLSDSYQVPGFHPLPTVVGVFAGLACAWSHSADAQKKKAYGVCGRVQSGFYDRRMNRVRDLPCGGLRIVVAVELRRVECRRLGAVKRERLEDGFRRMFEWLTATASYAAATLHLILQAERDRKAPPS